MRKLVVCLLTLLFLITVYQKDVYAITGNNSGLAGLWEYPTAEIPDDGSGRFGYTHASPYAYYFIDLAWLPWLEINTRLTTFDTVRLSSGRYYMDKAIDLKAMLYYNKDPHNWFLPSLAFGVTDVTGTEIMKAYYGVATWKFGQVYATLGYGSDRMNGVYTGLAWDIGNFLTLKAEYSPLDYTEDKALGQRVLKGEPSEKFNYGLVLKAPWGTELAASRQRGDEYVVTISQRLNLNGPYIGEGKKHAYNMPGDLRVAEWEDADIEIIIDRVKEALEKFVKVRNIELNITSDDENNKHKITLAYENYGHASHAEAMVRILVVLASVMPETDELVLIQKIAGVPVVTAKFSGEILFDIRARELRDNDHPLNGAVFAWAGDDVDAKELSDFGEKALQTRGEHELKAMIVYEPRIDQTLDKSYEDRWNIDLIYNGRYTNGWNGVVDIKFPLENDVDIWWEPDMNDKIRIQNAGLMYANTIGENSRFWFLGEGGYMDEEWFGANLWARYYGGDGSWWIGTRLSALRAREPESFGGLLSGQLAFFGPFYYDDKDKDAWRFATWLQAGINFATFDVDLQIDYGRYIDEDKGFKISATRHWDDTAIGYWYTKTDVHAPGKDYTKAGVHLEIPAEKWFGSWFGYPSAHIWEQDTLLISTWTLESGRDTGYIRTPEKLLGQMRPSLLRHNVARLLRDYCSYEEVDEKEMFNVENDDTQEIRSILDYIWR